MEYAKKMAVWQFGTDNMGLIGLLRMRIQMYNRYQPAGNPYYLGEGGFKCQVPYGPVPLNLEDSTCSMSSRYRMSSYLMGIV